MKKWLIGVAAFLLLFSAALYLFDWNLLRPYVERKVSAATGRPFAINGDLAVRLSLRPLIMAHDIVLGNAEWSRDPNMAEIRRLDFRIDILKLLAGRLAFPEIALSEPRFILEVNKNGTPNWVFRKEDQDNPVEFPSIRALTIDHGHATYRDATVDTDLSLDIKTLVDDQAGPEPMVEALGKGRFKGMSATINARGGALLSLRSADRPYPIKARAVFGSTKASIDGVLLDPLHLKGEQLNFQLEGSDLALLYPIVGVPIPPTPAYKLAGYLDHVGEIWSFRKFRGTVGHSDVAGDLSVDRGRKPQRITADLVSRNLDLKDLGGFIGADRGTRPSDVPPPGDKVLPTEPFSLEKLRAADADVRFRGAKIVTSKLPLEKMNVHLFVNDGTLKLAPLDFAAAGGNLVSQIEMDGRQASIVTHADITARGLHLDQLFPNSKLAAVNAGTMGGRAKLDTSGNSISQMLGSANGEAAVIMDGGSVSELMLRLSNLDIANSIAVLLGGDRQVPIRCLVGNFKAVNGDFKVEALVLDTPKVSIIGDGGVNFADESLNLRLAAQSKGFSLASLRGPIDITGSFKNPSVRPAMGKVIARGGLAVALGAVTGGPGALIPLLEFGRENDSNCTALINQAKSDAGVKSSDISPRRPPRR